MDRCASTKMDPRTACASLMIVVAPDASAAGLISRWIGISGSFGDLESRASKGWGRGSTDHAPRSLW